MINNMFATDESLPAATVNSWERTVMWRSTKNRYRPGHKRCNWFVGVNFFDEVELSVISDSDITFETCRSGGNGGQNGSITAKRISSLYPFIDDDSEIVIAACIF